MYATVRYTIVTYCPLTLVHLRYISTFVIISVLLRHFYAIAKSHNTALISRSTSYLPESKAMNNQLGKSEQLPLTLEQQNLHNDVTVVIGYFEIGKFSKGRRWDVFAPRLYSTWLTVFARLESPVIGFFDTDRFLGEFQKIRRHLPGNLTVAKKIDKKGMWSFGLRKKIANIFAQPGYPRYYPNTVSPSYSSAMHAKYEVTQMAIQSNPFKTRYFCWLDIGLFRDLATGTNTSYPITPRFSLYLPPDFRDDSIAYQEVYVRNETVSVQDIIFKNLPWVCGCFFIGRLDVMYRWTEEYKSAVHKLIDNHQLMSTDQQVIYAAFNSMSPTTKFQLYSSDGRYDDWFHLGYVSRDAGQARQQTTPSYIRNITVPLHSPDFSHRLNDNIHFATATH